MLSSIHYLPALSTQLSSEMKTLAAFSKPYEAHLLISRLEGSGIAAFARDENMVTLDWLASNAVGGVDVADEDYDKALAVIAAEVTSDEKTAAASSSTRISELERGIRRAIGAFLLGAIPSGFLAFYVTPAPHSDHVLALYETPPTDMRPLVAGTAAMVGGILVNRAFSSKKPETSPDVARPASGPT